MKKLNAVFVCLFFLISCSAQEIPQYLGTPNTGLHIRGRLYVDSLIILPYSDTTHINAPIGEGSFLYQKFDRTPYIFNGWYWEPLTKEISIRGFYSSLRFDSASERLIAYKQSGDSTVIFMPEVDRVWLGDSSRYPTKGYADAKYQPKGTYLTTEVDPGWTADSASYPTKPYADAKYQPKGPYLTQEVEPDFNSSLAAQINVEDTAWWGSNSNGTSALDTSLFHQVTSDSTIKLTGGGKALGDLNISLGDSIIAVDTSGVPDPSGLYDFIGSNGINIDSGTNTQLHNNIHASLDLDYLAAHETDQIANNKTITINGISHPLGSNPSFTVNSGGSSDNWGSQVVQHDGTMTGDGTSAIPLALNPDYLVIDTTGMPAGTIGGTVDLSAIAPILYNSGVISHATSGVTAGNYNSVTVDQYGHVAAGSMYAKIAPDITNGDSPIPIAGFAAFNNSTTTGSTNFPSSSGIGLAVQRNSDSTSSSSTGSFRLWTGRDGTSDFFLRKYMDNVTGTWTPWMKIWTDNNDGAGSGMDADLLDGQSGSYYLDDKIVSLTGAGGTTVTGTYPNFTISSTTGGGTADNWGTQVVEHDATLEGDGTTGSPLKIEPGKIIMDTTGMPTDTISAVTSVNGQTGAVTLTTDNVAEGTKKYDKTVSLNGSGATIVTGTYPNFTISSSDNNTTYTGGTGINVSGSTITNTAPDRTVSLTGSGATTVTGTYPNFTITSTDTSGSGGGGTSYNVFSRSVNGLVPSPGGATTTRYLREDGSWWTPPDNNTTYGAGTGLSLSGTTFNAQTGTALWNASKLQDFSISTTNPTSGQLLRFDGTSWVPYTPPYLTSYSENDPNVTAFTKSLTSAGALLTQVKTVDGAGSGLDADLLDGQSGSYYLDDQVVNITSGTGISVLGGYPNFTVSQKLGGGTVNMIESVNSPIINVTTGTTEVLQQDGSDYSLVIPAGTFFGTGDHIMIRIKFLCDLSTTGTAHLELGINGTYMDVTDEQSSTFSNEVLLTNYNNTGLQASYRVMGSTGVNFSYTIYNPVNITQNITLTLRIVSSTSGGSIVSIQPFTVEVSDLVSGS